MQQVIYLEVEDELPAIRDLLEGAQAKRVLLVVPKGCRALRNAINLRVLRRYAANLALDVALVTRDSRTRQLAKEEGLAVLSSFRRGQRGRWRTGAPRRSSAQRAATARIAGIRAGLGDVGYGDVAIRWAGRILAILRRPNQAQALAGAARSRCLSATSTARLRTSTSQLGGAHRLSR